MQRRTADRIVGSAIALVIVVGLISTWQAWQTSRQASSGMMMNGMMTTSMYTGPSPILILFGTVAVVSLIGVGYVVVREGQTRQSAPQFDRESSASAGTETASTEATGDGAGSESTAGEQGSTDAEPSASGQDSAASSAESSGSSAASSRPPILDVLPEDERRILEPVIESPGLTQIALRDRADFSKSKVSQTVSDLEKRGLLSRERQGRTYRIYPTDDLTEQE